MISRTTINFPLEQVRVYDQEGRRIPRERAAALFTRPRLILYMHEGLTVDPEYLRIAREGTPFLVLPALDPRLRPGTPPPPPPPPDEKTIKDLRREAEELKRRVKGLEPPRPATKGVQ